MGGKIEFSVEMIEEQGDIIFIVGHCYDNIAVGDFFHTICEYTSVKGMEDEMIERGSVNLRAESILVDGQNASKVRAGANALIQFSGDCSQLVRAIQLLDSQAVGDHWQSHTERYVTMTILG